MKNSLYVTCNTPTSLSRRFPNSQNETSLPAGGGSALRSPLPPCSMSDGRQLRRDEKPHRGYGRATQGSEPRPQAETERSGGGVIGGTAAATGSSSRDPELDFLSVEFNALKALYTPGLMPPMKIKPLDCVARARVLLPPEHPDHIPPSSLKRKERSAESIAAQERAKSRTVVKQQQQQVLKASSEYNPLKDIMDTVNPKAPVAILREVVEARGRVRVVTRHAGGVRGVAVGFLIAFDKYMNLLLRDVDEDYKVRVQVSRTKVQTVTRVAAGNTNSTGVGACDASVDALTETLERSRIRWRPKLEVRKRHLKQVLIRGDSVVLVNPV